MKKIIGIIAIVFLFSGIAFGASPIEKSQVFMKAGDFYQAKRVLEAEYRENPSAKILYLLGTAYLMSGNYRSAMREYEKSVKLDPSYKNKIARILADQGSDLVAKYKFDDAKKCFVKAAEYCSDYHQTIPASLIKKGKDILVKTKDIYTSFLYFNLAKDINPQFNENIAIYFWTASKALQSNNEDSLRTKALIYSYIPLFSRKYDKKMGIEFARMAKLNSVPKKLKKSFKKSAKTLLSKADFEKIFPPPTWKQVGETKTFAGKGIGDDNDQKFDVKTLRSGIDYKIGQMITFKGKNVEIWYNRKWNKTSNGKFSYTVKYTKSGNRIPTRAPKGEIFTVIVKELK